MEATNETQSEEAVEETQPIQEQQGQTNTEAKEDPKELERKANAYELTYAVSNLVCQLTVLLAMIFGVATLFSSLVNPIFAINSIIALFSIRKGNVYETLAAVAATAVYVFLLVLIIKSTVRAIKTFLRIVRKNKAYLKLIGLNTSYREAMGVTFKAVFFMALCRMLSGGTLTVGSYFVIAVFLIDYVLTSTLTFIQRNKANFKTKEIVTEFIFSLLRNGIIIACVCLSAKYLILPSGLDLAFGLRSLFGCIAWSARIVHVLYDLIIKHVLDIVIAVFYLIILQTLFYDAGYATSTRNSTNESVKSLSRKLLIIAGASAAVSCILLIVNGFNTQFDISILENCFYVLKVQYLPAILLVAVLFVLAVMPFERKTAVEQKT